MLITQAKEKEAMGRCKKHPDRETSYKCEKYDTYLCQDCLACKDPKIYCKHRSACSVYFTTQKGFDKKE